MYWGECAQDVSSNLRKDKNNDSGPRSRLCGHASKPRRTRAQDIDGSRAPSVPNQRVTEPMRRPAAVRALPEAIGCV